MSINKLDNIILIKSIIVNNKINSNHYNIEICKF